MNRASTIIRLDNVSFRYAKSDTPVFEDLSLDIQENTVTALLGPNGSGKTTLLHLLLGLLNPDRGNIRIGPSKNKTNPAAHHKRMIGIAPQYESVPFDLSVLEYVLLGRAPYIGMLQRPSRKDRRIAAESLNMVGLEKLAARSVKSLSGGEKQLAMVARVLTQQSRIFLMDEPTSHLDLSNTKRILKLMKALSRKGKTVIFTTHDPNAAAGVSEHLILLNQGKIVEMGPPEKALTASNIKSVYGVDVEVVSMHGKPIVLVYHGNNSI